MIEGYHGAHRAAVEGIVLATLIAGLLLIVMVTFGL